MGNQPRAAKTTRKAPRWPVPTHVLPEHEHELHDRAESCRCQPDVEKWTIDGRTSVRIVHRDLAPRAEQVQPPSPERAAGLREGP